MKKLLIILFAVLIVLGGAAGAYVFLKDDGNDEASQQPVENVEPQDFPAKADGAPDAAESEQFTSDTGNVAFSHPSNWNVAKSTENPENTQLYTVESPMDANEFYFCLDLFIANPAYTESFESKGIEVLSVSPMNSGLNSVIYKLSGERPLYWNVTETAPQVGASTFTREITRSDNTRFQVFGRFNCREGTPTVLTENEIQESRWLNEAKDIVESIEL